jgi:glutamate-1-semialdehyde 2,1-aminomutase
MEQQTIALITLGAALSLALPWLRRRLQLSRAKHRSLAGHSRLARRVASLLPGYAYGEARFFAADDAPRELQAQRRAGFERLCAEFAARFGRGAEMSAMARQHMPDLQFTSRYRVPFQFSPYLCERLRMSSFLQRSHGLEVEDVDGNTLIDLTGSYGVNLLGHEVYKQCIAEGVALVRDLGPVLGAYHPCVLENVQRLVRIAGQDQVSFHMSGTEAVMQAVRLARYHTRRSSIWCASAAPTTAGGKTCSPAPATRCHRATPTRSRRWPADTARCCASDATSPACSSIPAGAAPQCSGARRRVAGRQRPRTLRPRGLHALAAAAARGVQRARHRADLRRVFVGFRLAPGGAQEYFGVRADMVTYGKTLGGGLPVGVVCGRGDLMKRYREDRPADICFARGTFNSATRM